MASEGSCGETHFPKRAFTLTLRQSLLFLASYFMAMTVNKVLVALSLLALVIGLCFAQQDQSQESEEQLPPQDSAQSESDPADTKHETETEAPVRHLIASERKQ